MQRIDRRTLLQLVPGAVAAAWLPGRALAAAVSSRAPETLVSGPLALQFDAQLRCRVLANGHALTAADGSEALLLPHGKALTNFALSGQQSSRIDHPQHGPCMRHLLTGRSAEGIEKTVILDLPERHPGTALLQVEYTHRGAKSVAIAGWRSATHEIGAKPGGFWTYSGATHEDRRDWVQPLKPGFDQRNDFGMVASDYGGGTPVCNVWRRDVGFAVGHLDPVPRQLAMPVRNTGKGARIGIECLADATLQPGQSLRTPQTFMMLHTGDHFSALQRYAALMSERGISSKPAPESAFAPIWCAWGYERNFTTEQVLATLPKVKDVGCEWAVLDDGWQTSEGDWKLDRKKFPRGEDDMRAFVAEIRKQGLRPRLWVAPLAVDPGTDLLRDHPDMLLLGKDGKRQDVTWWDSYTLCPAYQPTVDHFVALTKKIIGDWGFEGLKLDGQHLNAVAPCHNPAHKHARPEESCESVAKFWQAITDAAHAVNPDAVVELCPCGTSFAFYNLPATDQYPSSDPLSSWQVRTKGKSMKALMGHGSSYAGDHVELSDNRDDFASSYGIGAVLSTKFTWPKDTDKPIDKLPPGGFVLTPQKEKTWRKWIGLYRDQMLPKGEYLGGLYDIGFDKPEAHVIAKDNVLHYAFYATTWDGPVTLRGLGNTLYRLSDPYHGTELGTVTAQNNTVQLKFKRFQLIQATPIEDAA